MYLGYYVGWKMKRKLKKITSDFRPNFERLATKSGRSRVYLRVILETREHVTS